MKKILTYLSFILFAGISGLLLLSCDKWELPTKKTKRNCVTPSGTLNAVPQQRKVDFSITGSSGTIDQVTWDFGNGSTTVTTGTTVSYTYPASGTFTAKATLTNTCEDKVTTQQTVVVSDAVDPTVMLQPVADLTTTSAILRMTVTSNGNSTITRYGICYSPTSMTPTVDNNNTITVPIAGSVAVNTSIPFSVTALQPNTLYYARSFATNSTGKPGYSVVQQFRTGQNPVVTVNGTVNIGITTAAVNLMVSNPGSPAAVEYGIYYSSTTSTPDDKSPAATVTSPPVGSNVVVNLTSLTPNKTYYYRPFAKLPSGEVIYGNVMSFTTLVDPVAQELIASVSFTDQSLQDVSGLNNHVKLVSNPTFTTDRKGKANAAILLDGVDDYFYMENNSSLEPASLSISIWIKPITVDRRMQIYNKSRFTDGTAEMYASMMKPSEPRNSASDVTLNTNIKQGGGCQGGIGWQTFGLSSNLPLNTWHHVVLTYSGKSARMYFDGVQLSATDNLPANTIDNCSGGELKFGAQNVILPEYFYGAMDDIRMYKRVLSPTEVQTLFNQ